MLLMQQFRNLKNMSERSKSHSVQQTRTTITKIWLVQKGKQEMKTWENNKGKKKTYIDITEKDFNDDYVCVEET